MPDRSKEGKKSVATLHQSLAIVPRILGGGLESATDIGEQHHPRVVGINDG